MGNLPLVSYLFSMMLSNCSTFLLSSLPFLSSTLHAIESYGWWCAIQMLLLLLLVHVLKKKGVWLTCHACRLSAATVWGPSSSEGSLCSPACGHCLCTNSTKTWYFTSMENNNRQRYYYNSKYYFLLTVGPIYFVPLHLWCDPHVTSSKVFLSASLHIADHYT